MSEWHSASISITVFHQDHFWGFDFRDCWIEYYWIIHLDCTLVQVPGSKTKHKMLILAPTWLCEDPKRRSQDIENDQWKLKSRAWPPTPYPLTIQYPPQACLIWGVTIGAGKTNFPFQLSLCKISFFTTYRTSSVIHPTFLWQRWWFLHLTLKMDEILKIC